ncbi:hypothetical protein BVZ43_01451B, partial [Haemophilus influenzae]
SNSRKYIASLASALHNPFTKLLADS